MRHDGKILAGSNKADPDKFKPCRQASVLEYRVITRRAEASGQRRQEEASLGYRTLL